MIQTLRCVLSLTPRFSGVEKAAEVQQPFQRFCHVAAQLASALMRGFMRMHRVKNFVLPLPPAIRLPCRPLPRLQPLSGKNTLDQSPGHVVQKSLAIGNAFTAEVAHSPASQIRVVAGRNIDSVLLQKWRALQQSNPALENPCFAPEFTQAVAAARNDVEVGIIEDRGEIVAIFPFQRKPGGRGIPVGGIVSDYQGLICRPGFSCDPKELLKACRLISWDFDRLPATQESFKPFHKLCEPSALLDLSSGYV